ncbi:MAG: LamG-like jellyroll fold domain-containing protein [Muribaculaceae bacterium]
MITCRSRFHQSQEEKFSISRIFRAAFHLVFLAFMLIPMQTISAGDIQSSYISYRDRLKTFGYISIKVPIYDDNGLDEGLPMSDSNYSSMIQIDGENVVELYSMNKAGAPQDKDNGTYWVESKITTSSKIVRVTVFQNDDENSDESNGTVLSTSYTKTTHTAVLGTSYAYYRIYLSPSYLKSLGTGKSKFNVHLGIDENNGNDDRVVELSSNFTFDYPTAPDVKFDYSRTYPGQYDITFTGKANDQYRIYPISQSFTTISSAVSLITHQWKRSNSSSTFTLTYNHKLSDYQYLDTESSFTIPALQYPENLKVEQADSGKIAITWDIPTPNDTHYISGDRFQIQRSNNSDFSNTKDIGYVDYFNGKSVTVYDDARNENLNGTFYYRIRRTDPQSYWGWNDYEMASAEIHMKHKYIETATARMSDKPSSNEVIITWNYDSGNVMTTGTKIILIRKNITQGNSEITITLPDSCLSTRCYTEQLPTACDVYEYSLKLQPGADAYSLQNPAISVTGEDDIYSVLRGNVVMFTASKGYYSDRVDLEWKTDGLPITSFSISAREHDSNAVFKQIASVQASTGNTQYSYTYDKAVPGVVYDFKIGAISECADTSAVIEYKHTIVGFRTPTGQIYGRVTFSDGQAVPDVEVRAEATDNTGIPGKAYRFDGNSHLRTVTKSLLDTAQNVTLEAWIKPESEGTIISKPNMYSLKYSGGKVVLEYGTQKVTSKTDVSFYTKDKPFLHVAATIGDSIKIYLNGKCDAAEPRSELVAASEECVTIGGNFKGVIDDVRLWNTVRSEEDVAKNYNRYLTGNEEGLKAYYTFDYSVDSEFFDISFTGNDYNKNHGLSVSAVITDEVPDATQLGYKYYTDDNGSYYLRGLPYTGNGTTYMIIPTKGIHQFNPVNDLRLLNTNSQSHTVNFTDKSSFSVSGKVTYEGGTIPVEGVSFKIDGTVAMDSKGNILKTDASGMFDIEVPVGQHEVMAVREGHTFKNDGKITNSDGTDRNYQDMVSGLELIDITKARFVGRVAGGTVQQGLAIGHPDSKNNLADSVKVVLTYQNEAYTMVSTPRNETYKLNKTAYTADTLANTVNYAGNVITILPNSKTGEFYADVIPTKYRVDVLVPGHDDNPIPGSGEELSFIGSLGKSFDIVCYTDSVSTEGSLKEVTDTIVYNKKSLFIKRYSPSIVVQEKENGNLHEYFGKDTVTVKFLDERNNFTACSYDKTTGKYTFGMPVYEQNNEITYKIKTCEVYQYKDYNGKDVTDVEPDMIPSAKGTITFTGTDLALKSDTTLVTDSNGEALWTFKVNMPDMTTATRKVAIQYTYVDSAENYSTQTEGKTVTVDWDGKFDAIVLGSRTLGTNFITAGPDDILFVLRDPPGSNSYSYLEKGVSVTKTNTYTGSADTNTNLDFGTKFGVKKFYYLGAGAGSGQYFELEDKAGGGVKADFKIGGTDSDIKTITTTSKFQTSSDQAYVGADGDLFVGFSTNITLGTVESVGIISKKVYEADSNDFTVYSEIHSDIDTLLIAKSTDIGMSENYSTLFAYTQLHIENTLIPQLIATRNSLLLPNTESDSYYKSLANSKKDNVYVSKLAVDDINYGKSNNDSIFGSKATDAFDGPSYKIYTPDNINKSDTIVFLNQSVTNWEKHLYNNEKQKALAETKNNVSFQAGSNFSYTQAYSFTRSENVNFSIGVGANVFEGGVASFGGKGLNLTFRNNTTTTHGGSFTTNEEAKTAQGFVLAESGSDYISLDICTETGYDSDDQFHKYDEIDNLSDYEGTFTTFIFKKTGGATKCPYEGAYRTKYYETGKYIDAATIKIEVPELSVENNFIDNVPSGEAAKFTLYLRNNSEAQKDLYYDLSLDDATNPNGAQLFIDGSPLGDGRTVFVPAGETITKILEVRKGTEMNYDNMVLWLSSQCQCNLADAQEDIYDAVTLSVHFTPSATAVNIKKPTATWTYNTKLPTKKYDDVLQHYMTVTLDGFDVNYENFHRVMLQYKPASGSEDDWITLMSYYSDETAYEDAKNNGMNAEMISADDQGTITYLWFMDDLPDQKYDIRAVGTSMISNVEYYNYSEVHSGVKDMYNPRLFGSAQPANGILTVNDEIRLNFNEAIAEGLLTDNNFEVTGIRNGAVTDHSVSITLDGENDALTESLFRSWKGKNLTIELWILADKPQDAVLFSHGSGKDLLELCITADNHLKINANGNSIVSNETIPYEAGTWAHVAMTYSSDGNVSAYYNYTEIIGNKYVGTYSGNGTYAFGASIDSSGCFAGKMHNARIWDKIVPLARLQTNSLTLLSGAESNLLAYYPMNEARGTVVQDKARGVNMLMKGGDWTVPEGRAVSLDGEKQYVKLPTGASVVDSTMDYTLEMWFKADEKNTNATLAASGKGDGTDALGSENLFFLGFENGLLTFRNNGYAAVCKGNYLDNNWHHTAVAVNRNSGRAQIFVDGTLNTYFDALNLGGLEAEYVNLGVTQKLEKAGENIVADTTYTDFFKGEIDEFRLWKLYRNESITANGMANKLDGTEKGLIAYYPFEHYVDWQGTPELQFTADCQVADLSEPCTAVISSGTVETAVSAPIKAKEPVSDLLYDFVVNDDALIINLNEPYERIEKSIVTFTVDGVRDLNGNEILSPVTWTAYIDRNQLKWSDTSLEIRKPYGEELSFSVRANNNGGSVQYFTIENMPSWLNVSPSSGTIDPASGIDVVFTINPKLNIGYYDEVIYMRNDNNVTESLALNIKVEGEKPDWSVNPHDFEYNMSVFGKIMIDDVYSNDEEDILASFSKGTCTGVCNNKYYSENDTYYTLLTIYGNESDETPARFKLYDASTGTVYTAEPSKTITFCNDAVIGSPDAPIIFTAKKERIQTLNLESGWSWISTYIDTKDKTVSDIFYNGNWTKEDIIKSEDNQFVSYYPNTGWEGTLYYMNCGTMYKIYCVNPNVVEITGAPVEASSVIINIKGLGDDNIPHWNYISYIPSITMSVKEALAGYAAGDGDIIKSQTQMAMYSSTLGWVGTLEYMEPGKGYMLQRNTKGDVNLKYPETAYAGDNASRSSGNFINSYSKRYSTNMTAVISIEGLDVLPGDCIEASINGECRGETEVKELTSYGELFLITIAGDDSEKIDFTLKRDGKPVASAKSAIQYSANRHLGDLQSPLVVNMADMNHVCVFPSPFSTELNISAIVTEDAVTDVRITNINGVCVASWLDCNNGGAVDITWKVPAGTADGVYIVTLITDGKAESFKVVKK